jgi:gas vesicle protein
MSDCETGLSARAVILSLLIGAIAGAAAVVLLAPRARRESSERIRGLTHDLTARASAMTGTAKDEVSSSIS